MHKKSLVLVTGLLSRQDVFEQQIQQLKNLVDIIPVDLSDVDSPHKMVEKILRLAPERFLLAGHSIGAWVALRVMKVAPQRVTKLCLLNTSARGIDAEEMRTRQLVLDRTEKGEFNQIVSEIAEKFIFNQTAKEKIVKMFLQAGEEALINQTRAMMLREDLRDVLPTITCPTLIIHAAQDKRFSLDLLTEIANAIPNAKLVTVQDCGHMSPMESPEVITELMRDWILNN